MFEVWENTFVVHCRTEVERKKKAASLVKCNENVLNNAIAVEIYAIVDIPCVDLTRLKVAY